MCTGDFNGDGSEDVFTIDDPSISGSYSGWKLNINSGNDYFSTYSGDFPIDETKILDMYSADLNGDGMEDIVIKEDIGVTYWQGYFARTDRYHYALSTGNSFSSLLEIGNAQNSTLYSQIDNNKIADFNGDGLTDIVLIHSNLGYWSMYSFAFSAAQLTPLAKRSYGNFSSFNDDSKRYVTDWDGDGISEILTVDNNGTKIYTFNGSSFTEVYSSTIPKTGHYFVPGDFNADGKTDLFIYGYSTYDWSDWQMRLSTGAGFEVNYIPKKKNNLKNDIVKVGDFNGDGCSDLMVTATNDAWNGHYYYISKNQGTDLYSHSYVGAQSSTHNYFVADFDGDGRDDYLCTDGLPAWWNGYMIYKSGSKSKILMEKVANGLNQLTKISYKNLSESGSPYTKGTGASFPVFDFQGALQVVSSVLADNGLGSQNTVNYIYQGAKIHRQGKGFLYYSKQTATDVTNNITAETNSSYNTTYFYPTVNSVITKAGANPMSTVINSWTQHILNSAEKRIFSYIDSTKQTDNLTGLIVSQKFSYNIDGNLTQTIKNYYNGFSETVVNTYDGVTTYNWIGGRLSSSTVTNAKTGETSIVRKTGFTYSTDGKLKPDIVKYLENTPMYSYKNYDYNSNGNVTQVYNYGTNGGARQSNYTYETDKIRVKTVTDPLGHVTTNNYNAYGQLSSQVDYLTNTTSYTYDNMGRAQTETAPSGFIASSAYAWGVGTFTNSCFYVQQSGNDGSLAKTWYDNMGREIRTDIKAFDGSTIYTNTEYNPKGQLYRISEPNFSPTATQWNTNTYDDKGRLTGIARPSVNNTSYVYEINSSKVTETTAGQASWKITNSMGLVTTAHDNGGDITYTYFPDGAMKTISPAGGGVTTMEYDEAGYQKKLIDPSAGTIQYSYNVYGQLNSQINGRVQTTGYIYLADGRLDKINSPEGQTTYSYNGNKQLTGISSPGSVSRGFAYDSKGRVETISENIAGSNFSTTFTYDLGRVKTRTHPSGIVETNNFNTSGYLYSISTSGTTHYTITGMNARQQITASKHGSSLLREFGFDEYGYPTWIKAQIGSAYRQDCRYDFNKTTGNLKSRSNILKNKSEKFRYDNLNRLDSVTGPQNMLMTYAANGNMITKNPGGISLYKYDIANKPYQLSVIETPVTSPQLVSDVQQDIAYTSFEQPATIGEGQYQAVFAYNSDGQRAKMEVKQNGNTILTRLYVGSTFIKETVGSTTKEYTWLGGDAYSAPCIAIKTGTGSPSYYFLLRDHLGSVTEIMSTSGTWPNQFSFDAWGRRRNFTDWSYTVAAQTDLLPDRGFTGHEFLPWFNLYNMNGRLYDPIVGRFLSPDNNVQMAGFTQSYNRYSYCLNNPLKFTDPDGELVWFIPIIIGAVIGSASGYMVGHANGATGWDMAGYIAGGTLIGGLSGGAASGISAAGGGAMLAGAGAGAVGGAGFSGLATGWDGNAMLKGAAFGAISGFVGGGVGGAIGGGWGALAGGASANLTSQLLYNGGDFSNVNWASVGISGAASFGLYHGMQYMQYRAMDGKLGQLDVTYRQYSKINTAYQRSSFWHKEYGVVLNRDGSARFVPGADRYKFYVTLRLNPRNGDYATAHTHWAKDGVDLGGGVFTVGGHHSPDDLINIPGYSLVVGRTSSTYSIGGTGAYNYITPDPFIRFFMFPWNW